MASKGIRDQVAVIGMGCTQFGELWDKGVDDLLTDATTEAVALRTGPRAGRHRRLLARHHDLGRLRRHVVPPPEDRLQARHPESRTIAPPVRRPSATPATRWRPGAYDIAMAIGVEKLKDTGYSGLTGIRQVGDGTDPGLVLARRLLLPGPVLQPPVRREPSQRDPAGLAHPEGHEARPLRRGGFERPGMPSPRVVPSVPIADRPPVPRLGLERGNWVDACPVSVSHVSRFPSYHEANGGIDHVLTVLSQFALEVSTTMLEVIRNSKRSQPTRCSERPSGSPRWRNGPGGVPQHQAR